MTGLVHALYNVKHNPFRYGEYIASFYSELINVEHNLLLAQLVIPLCSHPIFSRKIKNATSRSSFWSIFGAKNGGYDARRELYDLQERLDFFKTLSEQSLQYCLVNDWVDIDIQKLDVTIPPKLAVSFSRQKNAANLGKLLSNISVVEVYAFLGVMPR